MLNHFIHFIRPSQRSQRQSSLSPITCSWRRYYWYSKITICISSTRYWLSLHQRSENDFHYIKDQRMIVTRSGSDCHVRDQWTTDVDSEQSWGIRLLMNVVSGWGDARGSDEIDTIEIQEVIPLLMWHAPYGLNRWIENLEKRIKISTCFRRNFGKYVLVAVGV